MQSKIVLDNSLHRVYLEITDTVHRESNRRKERNDNEELVQQARIFERTIHRNFMRAYLLLFKVIEDRGLDTKL